jgi:lactoylglutathione lyase
MKYLHTMVRVTDIDASLRFYRDALGLKELSRKDSTQGRFTLVFLAAPGDESAQVELTHNWDPEAYTGGRNFGHLAYEVDDIYATCQHLADQGVVINRPPRDGRMAFIRSPDNISVAAPKGCGAGAGRTLDLHAERRRLVATHLQALVQAQLRCCIV